MNKELEIKKNKLLKEIIAIEKIEKEENKIKIDSFLKELEKEIINCKSFLKFVKKGKITVELSYEIDINFFVGYQSLYEEKQCLDYDLDYGSCFINSTKQPKDYDICKFLKFPNLFDHNMQYEDLMKIDPDLKKHCNNFRKAKEKLVNKANKICKKNEINEKIAFEELYNHLIEDWNV